MPVRSKSDHKAAGGIPGTYAWISFSAKDGRHISEGTPISECASLLDSCSQIAAIGINCTPIEHIPPLIEEIKRAASKPIIAYPNSGEQYDPVTKPGKAQRAKTISEKARKAGTKTA